MIHSVFGVDLGYYDSIVVAGRDADDPVVSLSERFRQAATAYERNLPNIESLAEFLGALEKLRKGDA